jgi:hypothetical protein
MSDGVLPNSWAPEVVCGLSLGLQRFIRGLLLGQDYLF